MIAKADQDELPDLKVGNLTARQICLAASDGEPRLLAMVSEDGPVVLGVSDLEGRTRLSLGMDANDCPYVAVLDRDQQPRVKMFMVGNDPFFSVSGPGGKPHWLLAIDETAGPLVLVTNKDGELVINDKD